MKPNFKKKVANWGNFPVVEKEIIAEDSIDKIKDFVRNNNEIIARGNGRCYGDAALSETIFSTKKLNKFVSFDRLNGILNCESGVLLSEILELIVPQGFFLMVTPGTKLISIGGAIASDVHGKGVQCFSDCLLSFELMDENGEILQCSRDENTDKFWATVGGMGLTGIILSAKIQLKKIETAYIRQESIKAENLDEIFQYFEECKDWTYNVAWIDCLQKGKNIGRSVLQRGEFATINELPLQLKDKALSVPKKLKLKVPFYFPKFILNNWSIKIFNFLIYNKQRPKIVKNFLDYESFFYPLDSIADWNKIYGKQGFIQYQMVIPIAEGKAGIRELLQTIANSGNGSFLAVLKYIGPNNPLAYNSFPFEGYTLALDFKMNSKLKKLVTTLDNIVEKYNGRIYLAKDSMSKSSLTNYLKNVHNPKFVSLQHKRIVNGQ